MKTSDNRLSEIFSDLESRYRRLNVSTLKDILHGKKKASQRDTKFTIENYISPKLDEVKAAFWDYNCAIFTAFRSGKTLEENEERNECLKSDMKAHKLRYRPVKGCYRQADWNVPVEEYSFFVSNVDNLPLKDFFSITYRLSEKYGQDSFLFARGGLNEHAYLVATNDDGRLSFNGDIKDAGQFYGHVPDVGDWTACNGDDRFAFQSKVLVLFDSKNKQIKFSEGNIFDTNSFQTDGIIIINRSDENDIKEQIKKYSGSIPLIHHSFYGKNQSSDNISKTLASCLFQARKNKCKRICLLCSASINDSFLEGARLVSYTVSAWMAKYGKKMDWIAIHDTYGNYAKFELR